MAVRRVPRQPGRQRARHGLERPGAREGHHDPRQEHRGAVRRRHVQHRRHTRSRRLRWRGGTRARDGRRRALARRRERRAVAADALRVAQGARSAPAGDPRDQQGRPPRRAYRGGPRRDLRAVHRPRRRRAPDRIPDRVLQRARGVGVARPGGRGQRSQAAVRADPAAHPRARVRRGPPLPGDGHEPRRVAVRRPARTLPRPQRHREARAAGRVVPHQRRDRAGEDHRALHDAGTRPGRRPTKPGRATSSRSPASPRSRSARPSPMSTIPARCRRSRSTNRASR